MRRWLIIIGLIVAAVGLAAAGAVWFAARSEKAHQVILERIEPIIEEALGARIEIKKASGSLRGALVWSGVRLIWPEVELEIEQATLGIDYAALRNRHFHVTRLKAVGPRLTFLRSPEAAPKPSEASSRRGAWSLSQWRALIQPREAAAASDPGQEWRMTLENIDLIRGRVDNLGFAAALAELGSFQDIQGRGVLAWDQKWRAQGQVKGRGELAGTAFDFEAVGQLAGHETDFQSLRLLFGPEQRSRLDFEGRTVWTPLEAAGSFSGEVELSDLPLVPGLSGLSGSCGLKGQGSGGLEGLDLTAQVRWGEAQIEAAGRVGWLEKKVEARGKVKNLDPARLSGLFGPDLPSGLTEFEYLVQGPPHDLEAHLIFGPTKINGWGEAEAGEAKLRFTSRAISGLVKAKQAQGFGLQAGLVEAQGELRSGQIEARVKFEKARGWQAEADEGRFRLLLSEGRLTLKDVALKDGAARLVGRAEATLDKGRPVSGRAWLTLTQFQPPKALMAEELNLGLLVIDPSTLRFSGPLEVDWPGEGLKLSSSKLTLDSPWGRIIGSGLLNLSPQGRPLDWKAELNLSQFKIPDWLWPFLPQSARKALLGGRIKLKGQGPAVWFEADLSRSQWPGASLKSLKGAGRVAAGGAVLDEVEIVLDMVRARLAGRLWPEAELDLKIEGQNLSRLNELLFGRPAGLEAATYSFEGRLQGDLKRPSVAGRVRGAKFSGKKISARAFDLTTALQNVDFNAPQTWSGQVAGQIEALSLSNSAPLNVDLDLSGQRKEFSGRVVVDSLHGRAEAEVVKKPTELIIEALQMRLKTPAGQERWRSPEPIHLVWGRGGLERLDMALAGSNTERVELRLDLVEGRLAGLGAIEGIEIAPWAGVAGLDVLEQGRLSATLQISGRPAALEARLSGRIVDAVLSGQKLDDLALSAAYDANRLSGRVEVRALGHQVGVISGQAPLEFNLIPWRLRLDKTRIEAKAMIESFPVAALKPLVKDLDDLKGRLSAEVNLTPQARGWIKIEDVGFQVAFTGQAVQNGRASFKLDQGKLLLEECSARFGNGTLAAEGWLGLGGEWPLNFNAQLSPAKIDLGSYGQSEIAAEVVVSRTLQAPMARGRLKILKLDLTLPRPAPAESKEIILVDRPAPPKAANPAAGAAKPPSLALAPLDLKMIIDLGSSAEIQGEGLKAKVDGELEASQEPSGPLRLWGSLNIEQGQFSRFGRRFTLEKGRIDFQGLRPINPNLEITALYRSRDDVRISLYLSGSIKAPHLELSSDPAMTQEDILAYLLFGRPASNLSQGQASELEAQALSALGGPAADLMKNLLDERLAPDSLTFNSSPKGGLSVETGKEILPDLYLSYEAFTEPSKPNEVHLEYRLNRHVSVQSSFGDEETTGVDMFFKYDF